MESPGLAFTAPSTASTPSAPRLLPLSSSVLSVGHFIRPSTSSGPASAVSPQKESSSDTRARLKHTPPSSSTPRLPIWLKSRHSLRCPSGPRACRSASSAPLRCARLACARSNEGPSSAPLGRAGDAIALFFSVQAPPTGNDSYLGKYYFYILNFLSHVGGRERADGAWAAGSREQRATRVNTCLPALYTTRFLVS